MRGKTGRGLEGRVRKRGWRKEGEGEGEGESYENSEGEMRPGGGGPGERRRRGSRLIGQVIGALCEVIGQLLRGDGVRPPAAPHNELQPLVDVRHVVEALHLHDARELQLGFVDVVAVAVFPLIARNGKGFFAFLVNQVKADGATAI